MFRNRIELVPAAGGAPRVLESTRGFSLAEAYWSPNGASIIGIRSDGVVNGSAPSIEEIDVGSDTVRQISASASIHVSIARRRGTLAWQNSDPTHSGMLAVLHPGARQPFNVLNLNPQVDEWILGEQSVVRWQTATGETHEGILIKPANYRPGQRYPMIIDAYPSQRNGFRGGNAVGKPGVGRNGLRDLLPQRWPAPHGRQSFHLCGC